MNEPPVFKRGDRVRVRPSPRWSTTETPGVITAIRDTEWFPYAVFFEAQPLWGSYRYGYYAASELELVEEGKP